MPCFCPTCIKGNEELTVVKKFESEKICVTCGTCPYSAFEKFVDMGQHTVDCLGAPPPLLIITEGHIAGTERHRWIFPVRSYDSPPCRLHPGFPAWHTEHKKEHKSLG